MTVHELRERLAKIEDEQEMGNSGLVLINNNSVWVGEITKLWIDSEGDEPTVILDKERGIDEGVILEYPMKKVDKLLCDYGIKDILGTRCTDVLM